MCRGRSRREIHHTIDRIINVHDKFGESEVTSGVIREERATLSKSTELSNGYQEHLQVQNVQPFREHACATVDGRTVCATARDRNVLAGRSNNV